jgi:hypothetical protein
MLRVDYLVNEVDKCSMFQICSDNPGTAFLHHINGDQCIRLYQSNIKIVTRLPIQKLIN